MHPIRRARTTEVVLTPNRKGGNLALEDKAMANKTTTRTVVCPNEHCGNTVYEADLDVDYTTDPITFRPIWRCMNCLRETPRTTRHRPTNRALALQAWRELKDAWKTTDDALDALVASGKVKSGAILVHGSVFNYHMTQLNGQDKPSTFDLRYGIHNAKLDLEKAKAFVAEKSA